MAIYPRTFIQHFRFSLLACLSLAMLLFPLASCGGSSSTDNAASANTPLLVWVDATRLDGAKLYQKLHPNVKLNIVVVDRKTLGEKILLFNRTGSGWPDVVFAEPDLVATVADKAHHYPADLKPYVSQDILNNFAPGTLNPCTIDGKLYCLRNDLAQEVLWYNQTLMKQFGYTVPTTWEEYQALGLRVAKEHPGYTIGAFGDEGGMYMYFWPSQCPIAQLTGADTVHIDLTDPKCTRVSTMLDKLLQAGVVSKLSPFDPNFIKLGTSNKILMLPAASWYGEYVFKASYKTPKGQLAAALPLKWEADSAPHAGAQGGSAWSISSHSKNPKAAADVAIWMSTSKEFQSTAVTFPAYLPDADLWSSTIDKDNYYAENPYPVLKQAAGMIDPSYGSIRYDAPTAFNTAVIAPVTHGKTVASTLGDFQSQLGHLAQASGYTVS